jgi:transcriptional regulator GlxA family with amidase domain
LIGGFDTGAWLLAQMGLLTGRRATIHWMVQENMAETFPEVSLVTGNYVTDGNIITCGGAKDVLSWSLDLIETQAGHALRYDVANMFGRNEPDAPADLPRKMTDHGLPIPLRRAILAMRESTEEPQTLPRIAEAAALSTRSMDRLFHAHLDMSAGSYFRQIRLSHARALAVETDLTLSQIATRTGFSSPSSLARAYRNACGETVRKATVFL